MSSWVIALACLLLAQVGTAQPDRQLLHDVTVIDVSAGRAVPHRDIVLAEGRIQAVRAAAKPDGHVLVLHAGGYVIPGLWDMHVHIAGISADPRWSADVLFPQLLKQGITSIRDMGGDLETLKDWRDEIAAGKRLGPNLYFAGPMVTSQESKTSEMRTTRSAEDGRKAVDDLQAQGVDFIKILHIPRVAYFALADEARQKGVAFVGHLPYGISVQEAAAAGQKSIEHINWSVLALDCSDDPQKFPADLFATFQSNEKGGYERVLDEAANHFSEAKCASVATTMVEHGTWSVPTLVAEEIAANLLNASPSDGYLTLLPEKLQNEWSRERLKADNPPDHLAWLQRQWKSDVRIAAFLHAHGVAMLPGSDSLDVLNFPGPSLHRELELLVTIGMTPAEALRSATLDAARFMGKDNDAGSIEPGKVADLVVLSANPLENISNTRQIELVISHGVAVKR
ncbi:MAG TPA: amidohydrolase family protein [Candidatus Koribacter sp.]|jgi:imidazolonepropionase-like amidohydrolase